jgi:hypothetical protein
LSACDRNSAHSPADENGNDSTGAPARGATGPHVAHQRPQHVLGDVDDLARGSVAHAQRFDALVRDARKSSRLGPAGEAVLGRDRWAVSPASVTDRCATGRVQQHRQLQRREVLHLVDHQVLVGEHGLRVLRRPGAGRRPRWR